MPTAPTFRPDPQFIKLGTEFFDPVEPADFPQHQLRWRDQRAAQTVGLDTLSDAEWTRHFGVFKPLPDIGQPPLAMRYHGHQFRSYNPDLGDGRGFLLAQMRDTSGRLQDLGTKGSGQTPWSRQGDGRLTLKGGVREVLAARMLEAHGVYTSRAFSLIETGEQLARNDEPSPTRASVLVRLQHSHVRFGTFQRHAYLQKPENLQALVDHCVEVYYPELASVQGTDRTEAFLRAVSVATAKMVAGWMAAGFVHGVLNTDNMNVTGQSFDYGPWRFLPYADANFTAAYFDHSGLYSYGRQPEAGLWNLKQLAGALLPVGDLEALTEAIRAYPVAFATAQRQALCTRLGLVQADDPEVDKQLFDTMFAFMARSGVSWDGFFHDWYGGAVSKARASAGLRAQLYQGADFDAFRACLNDRQPSQPDRLSHAYFSAPEPVSLVIEEVERIWDDIAQRDDWTAFHAKIAHIEAQQEAIS
jgi:serine/tyrosine/threonine adenylyltransferase